MRKNSMVLKCITFSKEDNIGKLLRETTRGGADVVIDLWEWMDKLLKMI